MWSRNYNHTPRRAIVITDNVFNLYIQYFEHNVMLQGHYKIKIRNYKIHSYLLEVQSAVFPYFIIYGLLQLTLFFKLAPWTNRPHIKSGLILFFLPFLEKKKEGLCWEYSMNFEIIIFYQVLGALII